MGNSAASQMSSGADGYADSPYSKRMGANFVRFWSEVFVLADEAAGAAAKWQRVVAKLVPVTVARVQDSLAVVSHVTAFNTKVDKIMDVFICCPGTTLVRGSDCFVYWSDAQKGLTWGLNFISVDDAAHFLRLTRGGKQELAACRRLHSSGCAEATTSSAVDPNERRFRSTSNPPTPITAADRRAAVVTFADGGESARSAVHADAGRQQSSRRPMPVDSAPCSSSESVAASASRAWRHRPAQRDGLSVDSWALRRMLNPLSSPASSAPCSECRQPSPPPSSSSAPLPQTRMTGCLLVKRWLAPRNGSLAVLDKEGWNYFWVQLEASSLHLSRVSASQAQPSEDSESSNSPADAPSGSLSAPSVDVSECIAHPLPEYPKREHVFCLSSASGHAYLVQASSEASLDSWVCAIHTAGAAKCARSSDRDEIVRAIDAELSLLDERLWEKLLAASSAATKDLLGRLGVFTPSAMHAYLLSKEHSAEDVPTTSDSSPSNYAVDAAMDGSSLSPLAAPSERLVQVILPNQQATAVGVGASDSAAAVLRKVCAKVGLSVERHFLALRPLGQAAVDSAPRPHLLLFPLLAEVELVVGEWRAYHVHLERPKDEQLGLTVRAQRCGDGATRRLVAFVGELQADGAARRLGLAVDDELVAVNRTLVRALQSPADVEQLLQRAATLCLIVRSRRQTLPAALQPLSLGADGLSFELPCQPRSARPARFSGDDPWFSDTCALHKVKYRNNRHSHMVSIRNRYSLPASSSSLVSRHSSVSAQTSPSRSECVHLLSKSDHPCLRACVTDKESDCSGATDVRRCRQTASKLAPSDRLGKLISELIETEQTYIGHLERLSAKYLVPLQAANALAPTELAQLAACAATLTRFQRSFCEELQEAAGSDTGATLQYASAGQLRNSLLRIGGVFLNAAPRFKIYSQFCAIHFRILKLLRQEDDNDELKQLLLLCNSEAQLAETLESYLIRPVQRVLRYPLFLQQIKAVICPSTPEFAQIAEALVKMEKVAEYINEMQRICDEYGSAIAAIQANSAEQLTQKQLSLDLSELLMFGEVSWLNMTAEDGARKRNAPVDSVCFVFRSAVVLLAQDERAKPRRPKNGERAATASPFYRVIPVSEVEVNGSDLGSTDEQNIWILIHLSPTMCVEKVYHFSNRRGELKQQFLRAIRKAGVWTKKERQWTRAPPPPPPAAGVASSPPSSDSVAGAHRPTSHYSSQSDAGYCSNGELCRKENV